MQVLRCYKLVDNQQIFKNFYGPTWGSLKMENSCAIDTLFFCLVMWDTFLPVCPLRPFELGETDLESKCVRQYQQARTIMRKTLRTGGDAYHAWTFAKHFFWQKQNSLNRIDPLGRDGDEPLVPYHARDNYMDMWAITQPFLSRLGKHTLTFTRCCPDCKQHTTFDVEYSCHALRHKLLFHTPGSDNHETDMSALILSSIQQQTDNGNKTYHHCGTTQYGSRRELGVKRNPADSITSCSLTACSGHFFVSLAAGRPSLGTKQMTAATIPSVLKLVDKTLHLHTIISRPNDNHFSCLTYVPSNGSDPPSGLYCYDGMTNYEEGTRTETKQENAKYCPEPPTLNLHEILALCYSESPIPEYEVKTRVPITVDQQPRPISIQL